MTTDSNALQSYLPRIQWSLVLLRLGVFLVMLVWTFDKFVNPAHSAAVFENFYFIPGLEGNVFIVLGVLQLALVFAFVSGLWKRATYGLVAILHGVSTLTPLPLYFDAFNNLLFFAAWPMWAACITLYLLRDLDTKWTIKAS